MACRRRLGLVAVVLAASACTSSRDITLYEIVAPRAPVTPRPEANVEVYRNVLPKRPWVTQYVIEIPSLVARGKHLAKHLEVAAQFGCSGVITFTDDHPVIKAGPRNDDEVLVLGLDGTVTSRAMGATTPNRQTLWLTTPKGRSIMIASQEPGDTVSLCFAYTDNP